MHAPAACVHANSSPHLICSGHSLERGAALMSPGPSQHNERTTTETTQWGPPKVDVLRPQLGAQEAADHGDLEQVVAQHVAGLRRRGTETGEPLLRQH